MRTAVITIVAGRTEHLRHQRAGLARLSQREDLHVIVAMHRDEAPMLRSDGVGAVVVEVGEPCAPLPLARARNTGARHALDGGAELLVFLDVDCIPAEGLIERYGAAARRARDALLCGPVAYLPSALELGHDPAELPRLAVPHPARPVPPDDALGRDGDHRLFWSLSFAIRAQTWRTLGGFCERYTGYGGEDTDFAVLAQRAGIELCWVGGAWAFHQHHATASPPVQHLDDILRNAAIFHERWGWWPMQGWLEQFAALGLAQFDGDRGAWTRSDRGCKTDVGRMASRSARR